MGDKVKWRDAKALRERIEELEAKLANAEAMLEREIQRVQKIRLDLPPPHKVDLIYVEEEYRLMLSELTGGKRMSDYPVKEAIAELQDVVRCRCQEAYKARGLHDPSCECDSAYAVKVVADRIEALEAESALDAERLRITIERAEMAEDERNALKAEVLRLREEIRTLAELKGEE